jgi:aspartate aminotransferase-like enzyme
MADPYITEHLMTAGPTPLPPSVSQVMAEPMLYAMESAVANLARPGEPALVASCGKFGERWAELCDAYGARTSHFQAGWGNRVEPQDLERELEQNPEAKLVFTTLSETSTGVVNDVHALTEIAHRHGALIAIDAVSGLGAVPLPQDDWGVDVVVAGSQKALMAPPGLAFASPNEAALAHAAEAPGRRYYFDWQRTAEGQHKDPPDSPFTPAVGLVRALDVALGLIEQEGLEQVYERHRVLGRATRQAARALELELFGPEDENANVVTAIKLPDSIDGAAVPKLMRDRFGVTIAGGQGKLKGKIARIAHCGYFGAFDIIVAVSALELALRELGHELELGVGVGAAQRTFLEAGLPLPAPA